MAFTLDVYDDTNTTLQGTLSNAYGVMMSDALNEGGLLQFSVDNVDTADMNLLVPRNVIRVKEGASERKSYYVHERPQVIVSKDEVPSTTFVCPSLEGWLGPPDHGGSVMYPRGGLTGRLADPRSWGPWAPDYDASGWGTPTSGGYIRTHGWPDPLTEAFTFTNFATYRRRVRAKAESTGKPSRMSIAGTKATHARLLLDGELLIERKAGDPLGVYSVDLEYDGLEHIIYIECNGGSRIGWSWYTLKITTDANGNEFSEPEGVLFRSFTPGVYGGQGADFPWEAQEDVVAGGVKPGFIMKKLIDEAQTRGALGGLSYTFDFVNDSDAVAWTADFTHAWPVGTKLLRILEEISRFGCDFHVDPTGELIIQNSRGSDLSGSVTITAEIEHALSGRGVERTTLLAIANGGMSESTDTTGVTNYGRIEDAATFGTVADGDDLTTPITDLLTDGAATYDKHQVVLSGTSPQPYAAFNLGDTVTLTGRSGSTTARATRFIGVQDDDTGTVDWMVEFV